MSSIWIRVSAIVVVLGLVVWTAIKLIDRSPESSPATNLRMNTNVVTLPATNESVATNTETPPPVVETPEPTLVVPIKGFYDRVNKKPFGIYVTPKNSPVQPEHFSGYHSGADAEATGDAEKNLDIPIYAIADGTVQRVASTSGYGGVMTIRHVVDGETITALYGHIRLSSVRVKVGDKIKAGQQIAVLGTGFSAETDTERKHLHFAVLKGASTSVRGYVSDKSQLDAWYDPVAWLEAHGAEEVK